MKNWKICFRNKKITSVENIFVIIVCFTMIVVLYSICLGAAKLTLHDLYIAITQGADSGMAGRIFWYVRLPRTLACILAGAGLAVSGAIIQSVLNNKLASPGIIGVNAGAGLMVTIACAFGTLSGWVIAGSAFAGALFAVLIVALTAQKVGASKTTVILGGVAVNSFLNAITEAIITLIPEVGMSTADFRVGGFSSVAYTRLLPAGILIVAAIGFLLTLCNELDVMALGEDTAQGLGLSVKKMRTVFLILAALLAGASVSFAGLLGFVGLIVPHMGRYLVGSESKKLIPFSAFCGAALVTMCDLIARVAFAPYEVPVGIFMSMIGGPFFITLLMKKRGNRL